MGKQMTGFIRPEIREGLWRARELVVGSAICVFGLWWVLSAVGLLWVLGILLIVIGLALAALGAQRLRFRVSGTGPGVVQITEAQVAYFGPLDGGVVALDMLREITLDPTGHPLHWILRQDGAAPLHIPVTARGAEALFDAFSQLPGIKTEAMLRHLNAPGTVPVLIWNRPSGVVHQGLRQVGST